MRRFVVRSLIPLCAIALSGCSAVERISEIGETPALTKPSDPTSKPGYTPVSMPVPDPVRPNPQNGSLWQPGARAFFKDQRAKRVGDLLTVSIAINDSATLANETQGSRGDSDAVGMPNMLGLEHFLPKEITPATAISTSDAHKTDGKSQINRAEQINLRVAAIITQVLPNGNMVISGSQEVRVNYDVRDLQVTGVIRTSDIDALDTIAYDKIAEARISYAGRGQGNSLQQPRYGTQLIDVVSPF